MLRLGLLHAAPSLEATKCAGAIVQLPISLAADHPLVREVERRCAEATGVPVHADEATLMMRHSVAAEDDERHSAARGGGERRWVDSLHVDTNNNKRFRCATVIMYLNDVAEGMGGE